MPSREAIHESQMIPETQSRRSRGRPATAEDSGPSSGGDGPGPNQRRRRIAEATRRWSAAERGPSSFGGRIRRRPVSAAQGGAAAAVRKKAAPNSGTEGEDRTSSGAGEEYRTAAATPANNLHRVGARDDSQSTGVANERLSRRVAVDVDGGSGRRRRRWWRRIFGDGAAAGIFGVSDEMGLQGRGG
ncbi:hypothetical protein Syun_023451 [Stephania yunnanensis]|uniref:Uncharacterized protein n=1 Tax=Stephania yunnanensis TaxID=152371 RepID=A0AAP0F8Z3_9MAGN